MRNLRKSNGFITTEHRHAQIEKEALGIIWMCETFSQYISVIGVYLKTDHKPLVRLFKSKGLNQTFLCIRMLRMHADDTILFYACYVLIRSHVLQQLSRWINIIYSQKKLKYLLITF